MSAQNENAGGVFDIFGDTPNLGSAPASDPFATGDTSEETAADPFAGAQMTSGTAPAAAPPAAPAQEVPAAQPAPQPAQAAPQPAANNTAPAQEAEPENLLSAAVKQAEQKQTAITAEALFAKAPVFTYAGASEEVKDTTITFEQLRIEKSSDFPELDDGKRVSWSMEYCGITKLVPTPAKTVIGKLKAEIENSKDFLDALKKAKDKNPVCKVKPKITAQSKGVAGYKGVFPTLEEADASDKHIRIVPARDGHVYEIRCTEAGKFTARAGNVRELSEISAGFVPALPPLPFSLFSQVLAFFHHFMQESQSEVMVYIYWDKALREYCIRVPVQTVGQAHISVVIPPDETVEEDRYIHVADIHSHNSMPAFFSKTDDRDELATRVYMVVGNLHEYPEICARVSVGGRFVPIDVRIVADVETGYMHKDTEYDKRVGDFLPSSIKQSLKLPTGWQKTDFPVLWKNAVHVINGGHRLLPLPVETMPFLRWFRYWRMGRGI